ncbi:hypothetical protein Csa_005378 [Cucumis sativus]|uniref:Uncharacterized protein n=1 Tax=Cucumis sativus TaxID=3659 RepID=A0A0A0KBP0_CUCSA|nr:hypothetical protein Csa_005378 [Cucumis sativus]
MRMNDQRDHRVGGKRLISPGTLSFGSGGSPSGFSSLEYIILERSNKRNFSVNKTASAAGRTRATAPST